MENYESPSLTDVGSVVDLTMGDLFQPGQDALSQIPIIGGLFGS
ncbi:hypothetical protein GCM10009868_16250 [Terrabacter aerolatus]|uniref:Lasso RiPP family leader peptide-containing protein n=1 Tax=Terrabacter aerolatus TaxID=422442 RepID=A0A512D3P2_9MICO|nr:lasso RiPP family leader peptide-containing protein [Terrabacter aerolatus]GEO31073.1 hypothetical protein TAE01_28830 [Terrabacter aerolatus]